MRRVWVSTDRRGGCYEQTIGMKHPVLLRKGNMKVLFFILFLFSPPLFAHQGNFIETTIRFEDPLEIRLVIPQTWMDAKDLSPKERKRWVQDAILIKNDGHQCGVSEVEEKRNDMLYLQTFLLRLNCGKNLGLIGIEDQKLRLSFPGQDNFFHLKKGELTKDFQFSEGQSRFEVDVSTFEIRDWTAPFLQRFSHYYFMGIEHIAFGFDHLLFLLALLLIPLPFKRVLVLVSSFTIAHSITLALSVLDIVGLPPVFVEAAIAASIVFVAIENLSTLSGSSFDLEHYPMKRRVALTFCFGLIHGFGFSYILKGIGIEKGIISALLSFNMGVETGQIIAIFVATPFLLFLGKRFPRLIWAQLASVLVALIGLFWLVDRVGSFVFG